MNGRQRFFLRSFLLVALFAMTSVAQAASIPEIEEGEVILVGPGQETPAADSVGVWETAPGWVSLEESDGGHQNYWLPQHDAGTVADGFVRARFAVGKRLDASLLFRVQADTADLEGLSGYGLSISKTKVSLHRWEGGAVRDLGESKTKKELKGLKEIEVAIWMIGPQIVAQVYEGDSLELVTSLVVTDTQYTEGRVGLRAYHKQDSKSAMTWLSVRPANASTAARASPAGATRFVVMNDEDLEHLPKRVDVEVIEAREPGTSLVALSRRDYERVRRAELPILGFELEPRRSFLDKNFREAQREGLLWDKEGVDLSQTYHDDAMVEEIVRGLHERYPEITALVELGRSNDGRPILALKISDDPELQEDEPSVLLNGAHHGLELLSTEFVLDAMQEILSGYGEDSEITRWVNRAEIWCVPLVNPDGLHHHFHRSLWHGRKNGRGAEGEEGFDARQGVDLNRNYPFRWAALGEKGSNGDPRHRWYRGPLPGSEPETQAMMRLADSEHFVSAISYHTWSTVILAPYTIDDVENPAPNEAWTIAEEIVASCPEQANGRPYKVKRKIYSVDGVDQDWFRFAHGTVALLVEGAYHNPSSVEKRVRTVEANRETWRALLRRTLNGPSLYGAVVDTNGAPVVAEIRIKEVETHEGERWLTRCRDGRFERMLSAPGTFTVQAVLPSGEVVEERVRVKGRKRVDFEVPVQAMEDLAAWRCPDASMCAAETLCLAQSGACIAPGEATRCLVDGKCLEAGDDLGPCASCVPGRDALMGHARMGALCGEASCVGDALRPAARCDAAGQCQDASPAPCPEGHQCGEGRCVKSPDLPEEPQEVNALPSASSPSTTREAPAPSREEPAGCALRPGAPGAFGWVLGFGLIAFWGWRTRRRA